MRARLAYLFLNTYPISKDKRTRTLEHVGAGKAGVSIFEYVGKASVQILWCLRITVVCAGKAGVYVSLRLAGGASFDREAKQKTPTSHGSLVEDLQR